MVFLYITRHGLHHWFEQLISPEQMDPGGGGGIPHGFPCTSLLPQILVDLR